MRHVLTFLAVGVCTSLTAVGQGSNEDFRVETWAGGVLESDFRIGGAFGGPGTGSVGSVWSARWPAGPGALFTNPALLGLTPGGVTLDGRASIANGTFGIGGDALLSAARVREATDDFLDDFGYTGTTAPSYTRLQDVRAGQRGDLGSIAVAHRVGPGITVAAGYHRVLSAGLGFRASGMEAVLDAGRRSGTQTIDIDVLAQGSAAATLDLEMDVLSAGLGLHLGTDDLGAWHFGAAISRRTAHAGLDWGVSPELMIVLSGSQQYFFNDPTDPNLGAGETNALFWNARARYGGSAWGGRAGLRFSTPGGALTLSMTGSIQEPMELTDPRAAVESYLPLFVNLSGELDPGEFEEEFMDVESLNLAKPNLTRRTSDSLGTTLTLRQPTAITFGLDLGMGPHTLTANYVVFDGELSAEGVYGERDGVPKRFRVGSQLTSSVRAGLDLRFPDRIRGAGWLLVPVRLLFLDIDGLLFQALGSRTGYSDPHYRIGGGLLYGDPVVQGVERNVRSDLESALSGVLPSGIAMARRYTLLDRLDVGVTVVGLPDVVMRTSLTYRIR